LEAPRVLLIKKNFNAFVKLVAKRFPPPARCPQRWW
jgi:hypothetical protein